MPNDNASKCEHCGGNLGVVTLGMRALTGRVIPHPPDLCRDRLKARVAALQAIADLAAEIHEVMFEDTGVEATGYWSIDSDEMPELRQRLGRALVKLGINRVGPFEPSAIASSEAETRIGDTLKRNEDGLQVQIVGESGFRWIIHNVEGRSRRRTINKGSVWTDGKPHKTGFSPIKEAT